ncbi:MAG: translocation/assembly module TamB domain-containing protein [Steroidobacteraceae bacterium]
MRRALRYAGWSVAVVALIALLLVSAVIVAGNTRDGRHLLEHETARVTSGRVRIAGLKGRFPCRITIARMQLSDSRGLWMSAEGISLRWSPLALLRWDLHVETLHVTRIDVARRPVSTSSGGGAAHLPRIDLDRMQIGTLVLEPPAAGHLARLSVRGSLHYRSVQDAQASLLARRTNGQGIYELTWRAAPSAVEASLTLEEPAGGPLEHWLNLPGLGALNIAASLHGPRDAEQLRFTARAGQLAANASGTLDLQRRSADLTYAVRSPAMAPRAGLAWRRLELTGRWQGPLASARANGALDLEGLEFADGAALGSLRAHLAADGRVLTVRARARALRLPGPHPHLLQGSPLDLEATLQLHAAQRPLQIRVTDRLFEFSARALTAGTRSATFTLQVPDLAALATLDRQDMRGTLQLSGSLAQRGATTQLDVRGAGSLRGVSAIARLLGTDARLALKASLTPTSADLERLTLTGRAVSFSATGHAERNRAGAPPGALRSLRARWQASLMDLRVVSPMASGSLQVSGTVSGALDALALNVQARSRVSLHGSKPGTIEATLRARGVPSALNAALRVRGAFEGAPLRFDAALRRTAGRRYRLDLPHAQWRSVDLAGSVAYGPGLAAARGRFRLSVARLTDLQPWVGAALAGRIDANLSLAPVAGRETVQMALTTRDLSVGDLRGALKVSVTGPIDALQAEVTADSPDVRGAPASVAVAARLDGVARRIDLLHLSAQYRGRRLQLLAPARVAFANGLRVRDLRLGLHKAVLALDGELAPALDVRVSLQHFDAGLLDTLVPHLLAEGTFDAEAHLSGSRAAPSGEASFEVSGLRLAGPAAQGLPGVNARGVAHLRGRFADVSVALEAGTASRLVFSGRVPLSATGRLGLKLTGKMDAALANAFLEARGDRAQGTLTVDAHVDGTVGAPQIHGVMQLANGDLRDYANGVHINDINARLVGDHGVLRIASLTARAGRGHLSATGMIGVLRPQMPIDVSVSAHDIQPVTSDILTADLDAELRVAGTLRQRLDVTGTIRVRHASITVPNGFPPNVATIKVIRPRQTLRGQRRARRLVVRLGLHLQAPESIFVRGRGLNAQLGGALQISGTTAQPRVSGGFTMIRGTFSLAGTHLNFTRGRVGFNGAGLTGKIDPTLDFVAQTTVVYTVATTVTLRVTGFADAPKISLSSQPPLPQDDLLALLLFGKPASQLTPYELADTGAGLASLSGIGDGGASRYNPLTWIRHTFGLNTFSVASATPGTGGVGSTSAGTSVTAGKYISNRVYVAATHTTQGSSQIRVDIVLTPRLKLETRLGNGTASAQGITPQNDPGSSIGLSYQIRY